MNKEIIKFDDIEIEEYKSYQHNSPIFINEIDINVTAVFNKLYQSLSKQDFKYFISHYTFINIFSKNDHIQKF